MTLVAAKDAAAFEALYDRHGGAAYSLAHRVVGDKGMAEDVSQEAFVSIWRSPGGYKPARGSVRSWTLGIVRNRAIDALRRSSSARAPKLALTDGGLEDEPAAERTDAEAVRRETARELRALVCRLPDEQRRVIELAYFGGFSQSEIAELVGAPLGTVKGRMRLGLEKIRVELAEGAK